jgi:hypothetical protein
MTKTGWAAFGLCALLLAGGPAQAAGKSNDFPTPARVEYVMACMSGAPQDYEYLQKCSCALDTIAAHMTYNQFVDAQTIRSLQQSHNQHAMVYLNLDIAKEPVDRFYLAEAYAELRCF